MTLSFIDQVHYIRIPVKDLEVSATWYRDIVGFQLLDHSEERAVLKVADGPFLVVLIPTTDDTFAHFTVGEQSEFSIGFTSPQLSAFHQHLHAHRVNVEEIQHDEGHAFFHFYDPSGNKLQVHL